MSGTTRRKCRECGERKEDVQGGLCEECEREYVWCTCCRKMIAEDVATYRHRHLYWDSESGNWRGTGAEEPDHALMRASLHTLLTVVPDMAAPLALTIRRGGMGFDAIHYIGDLLGYSTIHVVLLNPQAPPVDPLDWRTWLGQHCDFSDAILRRAKQDYERDDELGPEQRIDSAIAWLIGLDGTHDGQGKKVRCLTRKANRLTLEWIAEWQASQSTDQQKG